jgi:photosystem II stability/assembly factor-like uncharacterized protein
MRRTAIALAILGAAVTRPLAPILEARQVTWSLSGLGGQNVTALAIDPLTPTSVYAGVLGGGVFKSTDAGGEWHPINNGLTTLQIRAVAIDPQTPTTLFAGTSGGGLFKTIDGGANWTLLDNVRMNSNFIFDIAIDPETPSTLYVGGNGESVLKTVDGGATWFSAGPVSSQAMAIDPLSPTTIYAGTDIVVRKSVDGGASYADTPAHPFSILDITIDPETPSTIYVCARPWRTTDTGGVLKSTDGGESWAPVTAELSQLARAVAIDPVSTSILYAALVPSGETNARAFRSTDAGGDWSEINDGLEGVDVRSFAIDPVNPSIIYAATTGGVFVVSTELPSATLSVKKGGPGTGRITSSPSGIDCGSDCIEPFVQGTVVTLTAIPGPRSRLTGWSGCDAVSGTSCTVTLGANRRISATFIGSPFGYAGIPWR